jgi:hypothetical protein
VAQGSSDSGKGGSDVTTPVLEEGGDKNKRTGSSRRTSTSSATASTSSEHMDAAAAASAEGGDKQGAAAAASNQIMVYEFAIPLHLVGRLIGKHGCFVAQIKTETRSQIQVKKHPDQHKFKLCSLEGTSIITIFDLQLFYALFDTYMSSYKFWKVGKS